MTTTKPTIDLAALAADLKDQGWTWMTASGSTMHIAKRDRRHIEISSHGVECCNYDPGFVTRILPIDLTDPIWQSALPILLRHVAGEGEGT